jgi:hypothetical protein
VSFPFPLPSPSPSRVDPSSAAAADTSSKIRRRTEACLAELVRIVVAWVAFRLVVLTFPATSKWRLSSFQVVSTCLVVHVGRRLQLLGPSLADFIPLAHLALSGGTTASPLLVDIDRNVTFYNDFIIKN